MKIKKPWLVAAILHWIVSFFTDRVIFSYSLFDFSTKKGGMLSLYSWGMKVVFLVLLCFLYQWIGSGIERIKQKGTARIRFQFGMVYFCCMMVLLLCVYPGAWRMDEFGILRDTTTLLPTFWQGYLTSCFYIFSLMILPTPAGIVVALCFVNSICVAYVCEKADRVLKLQHKFWLLLPFFAFPILDSNMYPMRMSVYVFLEMTLAVMFVTAIYEKRRFTISEKVAVVVLTALCAVWRTEGIYYLVWIPLVYLFVFFKNSTQKKREIGYVAVICFAGILVFLPQNLGNKMVSGDQYEITSIVLPMAPLLTEADKNREVQDLKAIDTIDKVLDTQIMIKGYAQGKSGISIFWSEPGLVKTGYTNQEYAEFKNAYHRLIAAYPQVFLKERFDTFIHSYGILMNTTELYESQDNTNYVEFREKYKGAGALCAPLRKKVLTLLELGHFHDNTQKLGVFYLVYSTLPALGVLVITAVILLVKKQWAYLLVLLGILGKVPLIFVTAPSLLFMYYYGIYLTGTVVFIWGCIWCILKTRKKGK